MGNGSGWYGESRRHREAALKGRSRAPPDRKVDNRAYSPPKRGRRRFRTLGDRDRFINTYFPERECAEDIPGLYNLPDGGWLGVRCEEVSWELGGRSALTLEPASGPICSMGGECTNKEKCPTFEHEKTTPLGVDICRKQMGWLLKEKPKITA